MPDPIHNSPVKPEGGDEREGSETVNFDPIVEETEPTEPQNEEEED